MVVLDVLKRLADADLHRVHRDVVSRSGQESGIRHVLDHRHGAKPEPVPGPLRVVAVIHVGGTGAGRRCADLERFRTCKSLP